jgi:hypothetical protein
MPALAVGKWPLSNQAGQSLLISKAGGSWCLDLTLGCARAKGLLLGKSILFSSLSVLLCVKGQLLGANRLFLIPGLPFLLKRNNAQEVR